MSASVGVLMVLSACSIVPASPLCSQVTSSDQNVQTDICQIKGLGRFSDSNSTTQYYQCDLDYWTYQYILNICSCPQNETFNSSDASCSSSSSSNTTAPSSGFSCMAVGLGMYPFPGSSTKYYECTLDYWTYQYALTVRDCPEGETFREISCLSSSTVSPSSDGTVASSSSTVSPSSDGTIASSSSTVSPSSDGTIASSSSGGTTASRSSHETTVTTSSYTMPWAPA